MGGGWNQLLGGVGDGEFGGGVWRRRGRHRGDKEEDREEGGKVGLVVGV